MKETFKTPFQKYFLNHRISLGGMAEIYRATLIGADDFQKPVALKFLLPEFEEDSEMSQVFVDEARICALLQHPNIVQVHDFGIQEGRHYMAMEYIDGPNLKIALNHAKKTNRPFPLDLAVFIIQQITRALDYAHRANLADKQPLLLIHRDVSPQNILISKNGEVKLADFGIAKSVNRKSKTGAGTIKGKVRYMSPEQMKGGQLDARSDQFSLGIVFYEMLTCINPVSLFGSDPENSRNEIPPPSEARREIPPTLEKIILTMLAQKPESRYPTCGEVEQALSDELHGRSEESLRKELAVFIKDTVPSSQEGVFIHDVTTSSRKSSALGGKFFPAALLLLFFIAGWALWKSWQPSPDPPPVVARRTVAKPVAVPVRTPPPAASPRPRPQQPAAVSVVLPLPERACPEGMVKIPDGTFYLGSEKTDPDRNRIIEVEWRPIETKPFCIDRFEYPNRRGARPMTGVPWAEARKLCDQGGKRLCAEIEWERACKGAASSRYPYGSTQNASFCNTEAQKKRLVASTADMVTGSGTFENCRSGYDVFDLSGNAEEWVEDSGRFERMSHIAKGGSAALPVWGARCSSLREYRPDAALSTLGFRCCRDFH